jgi:hypothetical protein
MFQAASRVSINSEMKTTSGIRDGVSAPSMNQVFSPVPVPAGYTTMNPLSSAAAFQRLTFRWKAGQFMAPCMVMTSGVGLVPS